MRRTALVALLLATTACGLTDSGPVPDRIEVETLEFDALGAQAELQPVLLDSDGREIADAPFTFTSTDEDVASVSRTGHVIARGNGVGEIRVESRGVTESVPVTVRQTGATLGVLQGRDQTDEIGQTLAPIVLQLTDPRGNLASDIAVVGEVISGGGWLEADTVVTVDGRAEVHWTLGPEVGAEHELRLSVDEERRAEGETEVIIRATARPGSPSALELLTPDTVTGHRGLPLEDPVRARVLDVFDRPIEDAEVRVHTAGTTALRSDGDGIIETQWSLGPSLDPQVLRLEVPEALVHLSKEVVALPFATPALLLPISEPAIADEPGSELPPLEVRLLDEAELLLPGTPVHFTRRSGEAVVEGGATETGSDGIARSGPVRLPDEPGVSRVEAHVPETDVTFEFVLTAAVPVDRIEVIQGDGQTATEGSILEEAITVELLDEWGRTLEGIPVHFSVERGAVEFPMVVSDAQGRATTRWRLGWGTGVERMTVEADSVVRTLSAHSLPFSGGSDDVHTPRDIDSDRYGIELVFADNVPGSIRPILEDAARRLERVIAADLPPVFLQAEAESCGNDLPLVGTVDDLIIFIQVLPIDGEGGTVAYAGPCFIRSANTLPVVGLTVFDEADLDEDLLYDIALHEFAHVLGFGTLWEFQGLLREPAVPGDPSADTHFIGSGARDAFAAIGGGAWGGAHVPVENEFGGVGTLNGHWRWRVFESELMTGFISAGSSPLSVVTVASLGDLGYEVVMEEADSYSLSFEDIVALRRGEGVELGDDIYRGPIRVVP